MLTTDPGNTRALALDLGTIRSTPLTLSDRVSLADRADFFRVTLTASSHLNVTLTQLTSDADLYLFDATGTRLNYSARLNNDDDSINHSLNAGTYFIQVAQYRGDTDYRLNLGTSALRSISPNDLLATEYLVTIPADYSRTSRLESSNTSDIYRFDLSQISQINLTVTNLTTDLDLRLIRDQNSNGMVDPGEEIARSQLGNMSPERIAQIIDVGSYLVQVYQYEGESNYTLTLNSAPINPLPTGPDAGNTLLLADVINSPTFTRSESVSAADNDDFYRITLTESGILNMTLNGLSGDADVRLIRDANNNGAIDGGEILAWQWERRTTSESLRTFLNAGTYFVQVMSYQNQTAQYNLATNFTPSLTDDRRFSIQINFGDGLTQLSSAAREAINQAARFWERVITGSSFAGSQVLTINVNGQTLAADSNTLAFAGPSTLDRDAQGRILPTSGITTLNGQRMNTFNLNPQYLEAIMRHEFAHVLGFGTLWELPNQSFVQATTNTYRADSYAGWAYGELRGTFVQTAVPIEPDVFFHWDETVFDRELMTPFAESVGVSIPLSQVTIASLRDLGWQVNYGAAEPYSLGV